MLIPVSLLFDELLLSVSGGSPAGAGFAVKLMFTLAFGFAGSLLAECFGKRRFAAAVVLSELAALFFTAEHVLFGFFRLYFSPQNMISGAGDVAAHYGAEAMSGAAVGVLWFLLYSLPAEAAVAMHVYRRKTGRGGLFAASLSLALTLALYSLASTGADSGPNAAIYGSSYSFHSAVECFGLAEASLLSFVRGDAAEGGEEFELENTFGTNGNNPSDSITVGTMTGLTEKPNSPDSLSDPLETSAASSADPSSTNLSAENPSAPQNGSDPSAAPTASAADSSGSVDAVNDAKENQPTPKPKHATPSNAMLFRFPEPGSGKTVDALTGYLKTLRPTLQNDHTGIFAGKNLIMICAESYCDAFIRPDLTPTLWRLTHNGIYFSNFYQPSWGGSTTTGELSLILGLDGNDGDESFTNIADNNHYFSMGRQLQRQRYFSLSFHNGHYSYYDRNKTHQNIGYDAFFSTGRQLETFCGHGYPSDSEMIRGTLPLYIDKSPFSIYYMTVSGHAPYKKDHPYVRQYFKEVNEALGDEYYDKTKYYICYQMELERALTELVEGLEMAGIADDTVIVMTGDHYPYGLGKGSGWGNDRNYISDLIKSVDDFYWNQDQSGCIIWSGCLEHELKPMACEIAEPTHSLDILPTVSNLFGVPFDSRLLPGRDVFSDTEPLVYWHNLSWATTEGRYSTRNRKFYPAESCSLTGDELASYIEAVNKTVSNKIRMSQSIMSTDYYSLLFEPEDFGDNEEKQHKLYEELKP